jgi:hypothetical protein
LNALRNPAEREVLAELSEIGLELKGLKQKSDADSSLGDSIESSRSFFEPLMNADVALSLEGISKPVVDFARSPSSLSKQREFWRIPLR